MTINEINKQFLLRSLLVRRWKEIFDLKGVDFLYEKKKGVQLWKVQNQS
ncbi:hypothetical protein MC28_G317 (plasmid) [Bacillus thuringiensis MC28]|nr:hypothetical protein MC28_G317 [Bacillus thuringiensis MC28]